MKRWLVGTAVVIGVLAYLAGFWPEHRRLNAATLSSSFFDHAREALNSLLRTRDQVTTAIAQTDPSLSASLKAHERSLRQVLGYPVDGAS
jgi:hypothetical protein